MATTDAAAVAAPRLVAVGAGRMGRGIAIAFAWAGHRIAVVDLKRRSADAWHALRADARAEIDASLRSLAELGAIDPARIDAIAARIDFIDAAGAPAALAAAQLVFEGVPERLDAKREAFARLGAECSGEAILTSTTSSILVSELAAFVPRPERFLNMHWLNPAYVIPVVELSTHPATSPATLATTKALLEAIGKVPIVCGPTPGYIVPRLQALVMNEAARMVEEGAATAAEIDKATRFGLGLRFAALGVVEFIDVGGVDILHHASREMAASVDAARYAAPAIVGAHMAANRLGLKTGSGFYDYAGRDLAAYRRDVLARTLAMVQRAGLWRGAVDETLA
jgi:3-hydroxybutyryl-CoA dehydrogenase